MKLVIAEKKEVALLIAHAICGVSNPTKIPVTGRGYTVCAAQGHLLELVPPERYDQRLAYTSGEWDLDDLPIQFDNWKREAKRAIDDNGRKTDKADEFAESRLALLAELAEECDCIVNAGDPDDEGQFLVDEIIEHIGWSGPVERVYINDNIEKNVAREFGRLKNNAECRNDGLAAYARAMGDFVCGINETRLIVKKLGLKNVSVGRVQTPTLALIVARDMQIERFVEKDYYELAVTLSNPDWGTVTAKFEPSAEFLAEHTEDERHVTDRAAMADAGRLIAEIGKLELTATRKTERKAAPPPYNITQLEGEMNRKHGYSSAETLAITQTLRDKYRAITYNRTSSSYLKEEHHREAPEVLGIAMGNIGCVWPVDFALKSKAFDDSKVTAHHGIIPQETAVDVNSMTQAERNVYTAIVERYAMQFLPPAVLDVCEARADVNDGQVVYKARNFVSKGWMGYGGTTKDTDASGALIPAGKHEAAVTGTEPVAKKTTPPKRYTEETLLADMTNAAKFVHEKTLRDALKRKDAESPNENGSIGTPATRHTIIETLKKRGFIEVQGKKNLVSTPRGRAFISVLPPDLKTIDMTARWWLIQEDIRVGKADVNELPRSVASNFSKHKATAYEGIRVPEALGAASVKKTLDLPCPVCGKKIIEAKNSCQCESNKFEKTEDGYKRVAGCGWSFRKSLAKKKLTSKQCESLLLGKRVKVTGMTSSKGKKFDAYVTLKDAKTGEVEFSFEGLGNRKAGRSSKKGKPGGGWSR